jgi:prevent-host-death family protein
MIDLTQDIHSLSSFKRNTNDLLQQMRETGRPVILTVNGKAEIVVQDAHSYQKLVEMAERSETVRALKEALDDVESVNTMPAREALAALSQKYGL